MSPSIYALIVIFMYLSIAGVGYMCHRIEKENMTSKTKESQKFNPVMDNQMEYILAAAILRKEPRNTNSYYENDIDKIEIGYRHHDIRNRFIGEILTSPSAQGFYTSKGRFVSRKEAEIIARACGQINGNLIGGELTSEDLW